MASHAYGAPFILYGVPPEGPGMCKYPLKGDGVVKSPIYCVVAGREMLGILYVCPPLSRHHYALYMELATMPSLPGCLTFYEIIKGDCE